MQINLPANRERSLLIEVQSGHFASVDDAIAEAVRLLLREVPGEVESGAADAGVPTAPGHFGIPRPFLRARADNPTGIGPLRRRDSGRPSILVRRQSHQTFDAGLALYKARPDKGYSLVDCISMETMRREGITEVLTHDAHFTQEGFTILL